MVLQQGVEAPVWGRAAPGQDVTVSLAGRQVSGKANKEGRWRVHLPIPKADGKALEFLVKAGEERVAFTNVLAGEVWLCSGQSNMKMGVKETANGQEAVSNATFPSIRLFKVDLWCAPEPLDDLRGQWVVCSPETVGAFSAVGYFFGCHLHQALKAPVGLIDSSAGGTTAEAWMNRSYLEADPYLKTLVQPDPEFYANYARYEKEWPQYQKALAEKRDPLPPAPKPPFRGYANPAASHYNAMLAPLIPYAIKGVVWYQGEAGTRRYFQYEQELTALIKNWRAEWGQGNFPFLVVQLPRITPPWNWPITREMQQKVARAQPNVGLAVTIDLPDTDLHPRVKEPIGKRLSLAAQALFYGRAVDYSGPVFEGMNVESDKIRLSFKHVGGGLVAEGGGELKGFVMAGEDQKFYPARAAIEGAAVVVSAQDVPNPVAVRYAFEDNPVCNLFNRAGLPASPFRTDTWPVEIK
jgi:sialate O-acetylesterase